ncbi:hypothetical protein Prede_1340 [Prevotella dentalis DSM 3688]|uniref:Uncharacterized protein n=1 Tax=Prevotella dentalis (strain ATCC 49559 / DSM 3688 / JCM 13448 / NCTC 12043 / ES 2772) TaxID=908937 RepID=F9D2Y7_PREDD|nr:hypothetical protein [Prevotella dentalis]AGB28661.1 hypothetical protein Prede_1340 [Prevotella dentalis DSM 3688]EGQ15454.1 hypothetical protein HMPREF9136_1215 [Prevotella dentalis DSM 3688]
MANNIARGQITISTLENGKDGNSVNANLALKTTSNWTDWVEVSALTGNNKVFVYSYSLTDRIPTTQDITFSIEVEIKDFVGSTTDTPRCVVQGHKNGNISDWSFNTTHNNIDKANGVYYCSFTLKPIVESNVFPFQFRFDNCTCKFRFRKVKVEYGKVNTAYIPND